jgi:hemerythrin
MRSGSLGAGRRRIRERLEELRATLDSPDVPVERARTFGVLEEIIFDVANEFSLEEMLLLKHDEKRWYGHRCSHEALLSAMRAVKRAGLRDPSRESLCVTVDAIGEWLLNHFRTVDARDEQLMCC